MAQRLDELRAAVAEIDEQIETLIRDDGFVQDLVELAKRRQALLAQIESIESSWADDLDDPLPWSRAGAARRH